MNKEKKMIPELRFPEFENEGEWLKIELGKLCDYWNGASHENGVSANGEFYLISLNSIDIDGNLKSEMKKLSYTDNSLQKNDLVMVLSDVAHGNFLGLTDIIPNDKYILNQRMAGLRIKDIKQANSFFLRAYININQKYFKTKGQGSSQLNLSKSSVTEFPVIIPKNPKEQQKIATCLSSLDEAITAHSQKLDVLKEHKKGLMQNLFPQGGERVPKFRFKEFENDGEWVEKKLGEIATFIKGKGISKSDIVENGILPCIRYGELYTYYNETIDVVKSFTNLSEDELVLSEGNDVIIPASGETQIDIATASCVLRSGIALGGDLNIIRSDIDGVFLSYYLNNAKKHEIAQLAQGISVVHLYSSQLQTLTISLPKKPEQQKIASCLSSLDALIAAQTEKIEQLKLHKKGLMQRLFPKIND
jgi:type I restriction enzyme, S subunit